MGKTIITLALALVMVLSLAGCGGGAGAPPAEEIVNNTIQALDGVSTYEFDMDMSLDMGGEVSGEEGEITMDVTGGGACDNESQKMKMNMAVNMAMTGMDEIEAVMEMYLIENMMYMMMDIPDMGPTWMKEEMPEGSWEQESLAGSQAELLEAAEVEVIGSENVNGIDCYVLELTPDLEQLWEIMMEESALGFGEDMGLSGIDEELLDEMLQNFSVKQWIAKDTYFMTKAEISMVMELTPEAMGYPGEEGSVNMDMAMTMLMYNYNQPVSIELPPEAEDATEMGDY